MLLAALASFWLLDSQAFRLHVSPFMHDDSLVNRGWEKLQPCDIVRHEYGRKGFEGIICDIVRHENGEEGFEVSVVWMGLGPPSQQTGYNLKYVRAGECSSACPNVNPSAHSQTPNGKTPSDSTDAQQEEDPQPKYASPADGGPDEKLMEVSGQVDAFAETVKSLPCEQKTFRIGDTTTVRKIYLKLLPKIAPDKNNCRAGLQELDRCKLCTKQLQKLVEVFRKYDETKCP